MDTRTVDTAAVVGDFYDDASGPMRGGYAKRALHHLAARKAFLGGLDSVIDGVANHMRHWIDEALDHGAIHFGRFALDDEIDLLSRRSFHFSYEAGQSLEDNLQRLGPNGHDAVLELARQLVQFIKRQFCLRCAPRAGPRQALRQYGVVDDQFAGQVDQAINALYIDADGVTQTRRRPSPRNRIAGDARARPLRWLACVREVHNFWAARFHRRWRALFIGGDF